MNKIEKTFVSAIQKEVNTATCSNCIYFILDSKKKPVCKFTGTQVDDCTLAVQKLNLLP